MCKENNSQRRDVLGAADTTLVLRRRTKLEGTSLVFPRPFPTTGLCLPLNGKKME